MRKAEIEIGEVYAAKISGKLSPVKILSVGNFNAHGWNGLNLATNKKVFIRGAARLRFRMIEYQGQWRKVVGTAAESKALVSGRPAETSQG